MGIENRVENAMVEKLMDVMVERLTTPVASDCEIISLTETQKTTREKTEDLETANALICQALKAEEEEIRDRNLKGATLSLISDDEIYWKEKQRLANEVYNLIIKGKPTK